MRINKAIITVVFIYFIGIISACSTNNISPTATNTFQPTENTTQTSQLTTTFTPISIEEIPTIEATKTLRVTTLSILDDAIKKCFIEMGKPIGHKVGSYYPIKENNDWVFRDDYNQETMIKSINLTRNETSFEVHRQGGKSSKITVSKGSIVLLEFQSSSEKEIYDLFFAPSSDEFVECHSEYAWVDKKSGKGQNCNAMPPELAENLVCENTENSSIPLCYSGKLCNPQPSSIRLLIWHNGRITKNFNENDRSWCIKSNDLFRGFENDPFYSTFYMLPGDVTVYHWSEGNCPKVTIEEIIQ